MTEIIPTDSGAPLPYEEAVVVKETYAVEAGVDLDYLLFNESFDIRTKDGETEQVYITQDEVTSEERAKLETFFAENPSKFRQMKGPMVMWEGAVYAARSTSFPTIEKLISTLEGFEYPVVYLYKVHVFDATDERERSIRLRYAF